MWLYLFEINLNLGERAVWERFLHVDCRLSFVTILFLCILFLPFCTFAENVTLAWDPNDEPDLAGYSVYGSKEYPGPPYDYIDSFSLNEIDPDNPKCKITDLEDNLSYYFVVTAYDSNDNESEPSKPICAKNGKSCLPNNPVPDIKANGSDDPITVLHSNSVSITINLDPGDMAGQGADWWMIVKSPFDTFLLFAKPTPIFELPETTLLDIPLPIGTYIFYFILDDNPNGIFDGMAWYDYIVVNVEPEI